MSGGSRGGAMAFGFLAGSLVTAVVMTLFWKSSQQDEKKDEDLRNKLLTSSTRNSSSMVRKSSSVIGPTSSFLTDILRELWTYLNVAGADTIRAAVEPYFSLYLPGPLKTLHFTKIDLGHNPLQMDNLHVRTLQNGMVQLDMDMIWDSNGDIQLQTEATPKLSFGVKNIKFCGQFSLWFKPLVNELPVISAIQYAFVNPPHVDLQFSGLAAVGEVDVLHKAIQKSITASLGSYVLPYKGMYKMMATNNYLDTYQPPVGVVCVTAKKGRGFVVEKKLMSADDIPDVYLNITLGTSPVWRTRTIQDNLNPIWDESKEFLLHDRAQKLSIHAWDEDKGLLDPDDDLGTASALVSEVLLQPNRTLEMELEIGGKKSDAFVTLQCDILPWTTDLSSLLPMMKPPSAYSQEKEIAGLLVVIVNRAFGIPLVREEAATFVKVQYGEEVFQTGQVVDFPGSNDGLNPKYECAFEFPLVPGKTPVGDNAKVTLQLMNSVTPANAKDPPKEMELGCLDVDFNRLKQAKDHTITETKPIGQAGASLEYRISLCGVQRMKPKSALPLAGQQTRDISVAHEPGASPPRVLPSASLRSPKQMNGSTNRQLDFAHEEEDVPPEPIGKVRLTVVKGRGLNISHELFNIDIPDAYCKIRFGSSDVEWKTSTQSNTCTPAWNESKTYDLMDHSEVITMDVLDQNERSFDPDVFLGRAKTTVGKVLLAGGSEELELTLQGRPSGVFITLKCELVD